MEGVYKMHTKRMSQILSRWYAHLPEEWMELSIAKKSKNQYVLISEKEIPGTRPKRTKDISSTCPVVSWSRLLHDAVRRHN